MIVLILAAILVTSLIHPADMALRKEVDSIGDRLERLTLELNNLEGVQVEVLRCLWRVSLLPSLNWNRGGTRAHVGDSQGLSPTPVWSAEDIARWKVDDIVRALKLERSLDSDERRELGALLESFRMANAIRDAVRQAAVKNALSALWRRNGGGGEDPGGGLSLEEDARGIVGSFRQGSGTDHVVLKRSDYPELFDLYERETKELVSIFLEACMRVLERPLGRRDQP